jgi:hypothetical protein
MTYTEVLPTLRTLNHKDKIRVIQFLANEVAREEGITFEESENAELWSLHNSQEAAAGLRKLLDEDQTN